MSKDQGKRGWLGVSTVGALVCFAILWWLDFPKPYVDDLFYCGGGLNLAQGGGLDNPLIAGQGLHNAFFVYPPLYAYTLAGWLKLFGISAGSMTAFPILMYGLISLATIAILRRHGSPTWLEWMVPVAVSAAFLRTGGLRPDALSIALIMGGVALFEIGLRKNKWIFLGFLLFFLAGSAAPRMAPFSLAMICCASIKLWRDGPPIGLSRRAVCLSAFAALAATIFIFLLMIHFRLAEFLTTFRLHLTRVAPLSSSLRMVIMDEIGVLSWPLLALPVVLFILFKRRPWEWVEFLALVLCVTFVGIGFLGMLGPGSIWFVILASFLLATAGCQHISGWRAAGLKAAIFFALLAGNGRSLMAVYGSVSGNLHPDQGAERDAAFRLRPTPEHRIIVDIDQARYLFGYRIPAGFLAYEYSAPFPKTFIFEGFRPSDIYVVGPRAIDQLNERTRLSQDPPPKWKPVGPSRWWFNQYPRWTYIIPAENCKEVRAQP